MIIEVETALAALVENEVIFVVIGGIAISAHGSSYITNDLDFCFKRTRANLKNVVSALSQFNPKPRGFPENLPYIFDESTLLNATNFTFQTDIGDIDLLGEVAGVGNYEAVEKESVIMELFGFDVKVLSLTGLIKAKRAAGRPKDLLVLPELEALKELLEEEE
jgi:hypothetical protein